MQSFLTSRFNHNTRNKFNEKSEMFTLIRYNTHGYRLWDSKNKRIVKDRNIKFDETNKTNGPIQVFLGNKCPKKEKSNKQSSINTK